MLKKMIASLRPSRDAVADAMGVIDQLREQNAEKRAEIRRIAEVAQPVEEALAVYDQWAKRLATEAVEAVRPGALLDRATAAQGLRLPFFTRKLGEDVVVDAARATETLFGLLLAAQPGALRKLIADHLADLATGRETMSADEQAKKLARATAELAELELCEEGAIRGLEAVGIPIARRADADPAAVLASDAALPS